MILLLDNTIRGGIGSVMGVRYVKIDENKKIKFMDAFNLYGHSTSQTLTYDEIEMWHGHPDFYTNWLEEISNIPDDSDTGDFNEVDLKYPDNVKEKTKNFPLCPENKIINKVKYKDYMKKTQPKTYTKSKKLKCDWTDMIN